MSHKKRYYSFIRSLLPVILSIFLGGGTIALAALTIGGTSITSDGALSIIAGGTDQNITLAPSGTGIVIVNPTSSLVVGTSTSVANSLLTIATSSNIFTVLSNGNVGIGTTNPLSKLDVNGGIAVGSYAGVNASPPNGMIISGSVAIGTANYDKLLSLYGTSPTSPADGQLKIESSETSGAADTGGSIYFAIHSGDFARSAGTLRVLKENGTVGNSAAYMSFNTRTAGSGAITEKMRISSAGNVGIGTTNPSSTLQVAGTSSTVEIGTASTSGCLKLGSASGTATLVYVYFDSNAVIYATTTKPTFCQ